MQEFHNNVEIQNTVFFLKERLHFIRKWNKGSWSRYRSVGRVDFRWPNCRWTGIARSLGIRRIRVPNDKWIIEWLRIVEPYLLSGGKIQGSKQGMFWGKSCIRSVTEKCYVGWTCIALRQRHSLKSSMKRKERAPE